MTAEVQTQLDLDGLLSCSAALARLPNQLPLPRVCRCVDASASRSRLYRLCGIHSGDAFLDNCGDCVGGTTGLVANDCSEPEPEPDPEIGFGSSTALGQQGSCGGSNISRNCPAGYVAVGYQGNTGAWFDNFVACLPGAPNRRLPGRNDDDR